MLIAAATYPEVRRDRQAGVVKGGALRLVYVDLLPKLLPGAIQSQSGHSLGVCLAASAFVGPAERLTVPLRSPIEAKSAASASFISDTCFAVRVID
jgi:hypothetical protein